MTSTDKPSLYGKLPMILPRFACPICAAKVYLTGITEWSDDGQIITAEFECETEPDIDSDEWPDWHSGHYAMPYVDWLPWEVRVMRWLNANYRYHHVG